MQPERAAQASLTTRKFACYLRMEGYEGEHYDLRLGEENRVKLPKVRQAACYRAR
jgi:hypothetical protein